MSNATLARATLAAAQLEAVRDVLALVTAGDASDRATGRRALLLAYVLAPDLIGTQRNLSRRMGITEARASQMLKAIRRGLGVKDLAKLTRV